MNSHYGFSDSDDESVNTVAYACSDPDHCDKGVDCDGEHMYSHENAGLRGRQANYSESADKSEATVDKPEVEYNDPPSPLVSDPVEPFPVVAPDPWIDDSDNDDVEADSSQDACSQS